MVYEPRTINLSVYAEARSRGFASPLARILAGRIRATSNLDSIIAPELKHIPPPSQLMDIDRAIERLVRAIQQSEKIGILTDYDADGLTTHAVIYFALIRFGVSPDDLSHWIGHHLEDGNGISSDLIDKVLTESILPRVIVYADSGSSDMENISRMQGAGISVIVTDHHQIPVQGLPKAAYAVVNPNRHDCRYPDKNITGCMVAWLVMSELRNALIHLGQLTQEIPKLGDLLDYVALGTVADHMSFGESETNRAVVNAGIALISAKTRPCWSVLINELLLSERDLTAEFLTSQVAPRLNARGRIGYSMRGFQFLSAVSMTDALAAFQDLDADNRVQRSIEKQMIERAKPLAERQKIKGRSILIVLFEDGHSGVLGIVASRLVDTFGLPAVCFTPTTEYGLLTGSMRSIAGIDAKMVMDQVATTDSSLLVHYRGHSGACEMRLRRTDLEGFCTIIHQTLYKMEPVLRSQPRFLSDGELLPENLSVDFVESINALGPYGRDFEQPSFVGVFEIVSSRLIGKDQSHLSMKLQADGRIVQGIWFNVAWNYISIPIQIGDWIECIYTLSINIYPEIDVSLTILDAKVLADGYM